MAWMACHSQVQLKVNLSLCETPPWTERELELQGQRTCLSSSCSLYARALSTYSFLLLNVSGILQPPGTMGTKRPSALWPSNLSRGITYIRRLKVMHMSRSRWTVSFDDVMDSLTHSLHVYISCQDNEVRISLFTKYSFFKIWMK